MSMTKVVRSQYFGKVNQAVKLFLNAPPRPPEGWLRTVRVALGMSGSQLAERLGVTKARVSKAEGDELTGSLTLKTVANMANALDCKFVYAIVPRQKVEQVIQSRAFAKAQAQVKIASMHMDLEDQSLSEKQLRLEVKRIAEQLLETMPSNLWSDD